MCFLLIYTLDYCSLD